MRNFKLTVALALALVHPAGLSAQSAVTGTVSGTVSSQRQPVPGVTVSLTSPALQGERIVTTGANGDYVAPGLPPGEYVIQFSKPGMSTVTRTATVELSGTTRMDADLDVVAIEALTVRGDLPTPIATAQLGANYKAADLDKLPVGRTLAAIAVQAPGVAISGLREGGIRINGSFGYDNVFLVDGTDVQDNLHGTANNLYIEEAVAETAVLTGGIPAEYGRFTGGVVNAITKSGGNSFSGSVRLDLSNPDWTEKTPFEEERDLTRLDAIDEVYSATLGGPILRDRLWFFAAGRLLETTMAQTLPESGARVNTVTDNPRWEVKLTGNIASNHTLQASYLDNEEKNLDRPSLPGSTADIRGVDRERALPNTRWAASYHGAWTPRLFFELKYSEKQFGFRGAGGELTGIRDSSFVTRSTPQRQYNAVHFDASDPEDRDNEDLTGSVSYFLSTGRLGSHGFKLGYERFRTTRIGGNSQTATGYVFVTNYVTTSGAPVGPPVLDPQGRFIPIFVNSGPLRTVLVNWLPVRGARIDITTDAFFFQDSWDFNDHLSFNLGIRYEAVKSEATGDIVAADTDRFTPRLAASYDVRGDAKLKLDTTYSQYAGKFSEVQFGRNSNVGVPNMLTYLYTGPNGQGVDFAPGFDPANYTLTNGNFPTRNVFFADDVKSPIVEEWTVGAGSALGRGGFAKLTYVRREYSDLFEDFVLREFGTTEIVHEGRSFGFFDNVVLDNTDDLTRQYQAIQVQGRYRITDRWLLDANYTHEIENDGNFVGEGPNNPGASSIFGDQPELYDPERHNPTGRLPGYQEHRVRVFSSYTLPIRSFGDVSLGLAYSYDSPLTFSYGFSRTGFTPEQIARDPGYARRPAGQFVFFGERGAGEYEDVHSLDLAISLGVRVWRSVEPFFKLGVRNVTNEQSLVVFDTVVVPCTTAAQAGCDGQAPVDELGLPTRFARGPAFGTARSASDYQLPREYRFSAGIRF